MASGSLLAALIVVTDPVETLVTRCDEEHLERWYSSRACSLSVCTLAQVGPIKVLPLYSTLPPAQQQRIFEPVSGATEGSMNRPGISKSNCT